MATIKEQFDAFRGVLDNLTAGKQNDEIRDSGHSLFVIETHPSGDVTELHVVAIGSVRDLAAQMIEVSRMSPAFESALLEVATIVAAKTINDSMKENQMAGDIESVMRVIDEHDIDPPQT